MFSLVATLLSIALVVALALATLYYGTDSWGKGASRANASKIVLQGQQLLGAAEMYYVDNRQWPPSMDALVSGGYLKTVPSASLSATSNAYAADPVDPKWTMLPNHPTFFLATPVKDVCAEVNSVGSLRQRGILSHAYSDLIVQCYRSASAATQLTVYRKNTTSALHVDGNGIPVDETVEGAPPSDKDDPDWYIKPNEELALGGTGGNSGVGGNPGTGGDNIDPNNPFPPEAPGSKHCIASGPVKSDGGVAGNDSYLPIALMDGAGFTEGATITIGGVVVPVNNQSFDNIAFYTTIPGTANIPVGNNVPVVMRAGSNVATCGVDVVAANSSTDPEGVNQAYSEPPTGPAAGGTVITIHAVQGNFLVKNGVKPQVTLMNAEFRQFRLPASQVTVVNSKTLTFIMPSAAALQAVKPSAYVSVQVRNFEMWGVIDTGMHTFVAGPTTPEPDPNALPEVSPVGLFASPSGYMKFVKYDTCASATNAGATACLPALKTSLKSFNYLTNGPFTETVVNDWNVLPTSIKTERMNGVTVSDGTNSYTIVSPTYLHESRTFQWYTVNHRVPMTYSCADLRADALSQGFSADALALNGGRFNNCSEITVSADGSVRVVHNSPYLEHQFDEQSKYWGPRAGECSAGACTYTWNQNLGGAGNAPWFAIFRDGAMENFSTPTTGWMVVNGILPREDGEAFPDASYVASGGREE